MHISIFKKNQFDDMILYVDMAMVVIFPQGLLQNVGFFLRKTLFVGSERDPSIWPSFFLRVIFKMLVSTSERRWLLVVRGVHPGEPHERHRIG